MQDLLARKQRIVEEHLPKIMEMRSKANIEILRLMTEALKDRKISAEFRLGILNRLNAGGQVGAERSPGMDGQQRLEMAKLWFENAKASMDAISSDAKMGYESLLRSIDEQMKLAVEEMRQIDEELKKVEGDDKRAKLLEERRETLKRAA